MRKSHKITLILWSILLIPSILAMITHWLGIFESIMNWISSLPDVLVLMFRILMYPGVCMFLLSIYRIPQVVTAIIIAVTILVPLCRDQYTPTKKEILSTAIWSAVSVFGAVCAYLTMSL